jgi:hypothetical protein
MAIIITFVVVVIGATALYNLWLFNCLVRWEYQHQREQWERDGKPTGLLWRPKECEFRLSGNVEQRLNLLWLFTTPEWAAQSPECCRWLAQKRIITLVACIVVLTVLFRTFFR